MKNDDAFHLVFHVQWLQIGAGVSLLVALQIVALCFKRDTSSKPMRAGIGSHLLLAAVAAAVAATTIIVTLRRQIDERELRDLRSRIIYAEALIREQQYHLGLRSNKQPPNKAPEPTPGSVTPRATSPTPK